MRQAGTLATRLDADRFANYLLSLGITSKVEGSGDAWSIWVHDENQLAHSKQELAEFLRQPNDARYIAAEQTARQVRRETAARQKQAERNLIDMRNVWANPWHRRPVTLALIIFSALVYLHVLDIPQADLKISGNGAVATAPNALQEIKEGEIWRFVSPIFLHFSIMHVVFNLWMLLDLGSIIERKVGSFIFALLVLVIAVPSNLGQFIADGPEFGGMSGVVFGLFGYAWVRGRMDPTSGLYLRQDAVIWILGWFALCAAGVIPNVANWAHGVGLAVGAALGFLAFHFDRWRKKA